MEGEAAEEGLGMLVCPLHGRVVQNLPPAPPGGGGGGGGGGGAGIVPLIKRIDQSRQRSQHLKLV